MDQDSKLLTEAYENMGISREALRGAKKVDEYLTQNTNQFVHRHRNTQRLAIARIIQDAIDEHHESLM